MKLLLTILTFFVFTLAKSQDVEMGFDKQTSNWELSSIDTVKALFKVSSLRYEYAKQIIKQGYIVVLTIVFTGDKIPCATGDSDCDYKDKHKTILYLDKNKKIIDEDKWHIWDVEKQ